ncbi:MAG: hypothetical protein WKF45_00240 [Ilumatobacteraceae bacterium]
MTAGDETPTSVSIVGVGVVGRRCARLLDGRHRLMLHDRRDEAAQAAAGVLRDARVVADVADLAPCATVVLHTLASTSTSPISCCASVCT